MLEYEVCFIKKVKSQNYFGKSENSKHLEIFLSVKKYDKFITSGQIFIIMQDDSGRTFDTRFVDLNDI